MADYTVDFTSGKKTLLVKPVEEMFEVVSATISDEKISQSRLESLIADATLLYEKACPAVVTTTESSNDSAESDSTDVLSTPKKSKPSTSVVQSSPISIADRLLDDIVTPAKLYNSKFIEILANTFFETNFSPIAALESPPEPHQPILLSIEGNIGAGKSTLLRALRESHPEWTFINEPLDMWTALKNDTGNLLECFYGDQDRWAYTFQNCSILSRFQLIEDAIKDNSSKYPGKHVYVTERSLGTDYHVFTKMLKADGKLDVVEYELYERWLSELEKTCTPLSGIAFVDTPPQVCAERIKKRSREGEEGIPMEYLEHLDSYQSRWLENIGIPCQKTCTKEGIEEFVEFMLSR